MYPFEKFTADAKKVLTLAQEEAERGHLSYIGTEHLLLGILRGDGPGSEALRSVDVRIEEVRRAVENVLGRTERIAIQQIIPTSRVKTVIQMSFAESRREGFNFVDSGHVLVGLMLEGEGIAAHVLQDLGATKERVFEAVKAARGSTGPAAVEPPNLAGVDTETLLGLLRTPRLARLLASRGLDVEGTEELLSHPPVAVGELRRHIAGLRAEIQAVVARGEYEQAARLQERERDLLGMLAVAEQEWIDGLPPR